jgi:phospholipid/cholesterol/gamma-HCH transport system substrate-binding protein
MRDDRINYVLVGGFVLAMIAGLVFALAVLTGRTGATDTYYTRYDDVTGLKYGSSVLYMGFPVGQVDAIEPVVNEGRVRFRLALELDEAFTGWAVPRDSVAHVRAEGLLAAVAIDIRAGASGEPLRPGDEIAGATQRDLMAAVSETANILRDLAVNDVAPLVKNLDRYVTGFGEALLSQGSPLLANLNVLSAELAGRAPELVDDVRSTSAQLRAVSQRLERLLSEENAEKLDGVVDNVYAASEDLAQLTAETRARAGQLLGEDNLRHVEDILVGLRVAAEEAQATALGARSGVERVFAEHNLDHLDSALAAADAAAVSLQAITGPEQRRQALDAVTSASLAAREFATLVTEARTQMRAVLGPQTVERLDRALDNVSVAGANFARLSESVDARLGELLTADMAVKVREALDNFSLAAGNVAALSRDLGETRSHLDRLLVSAHALSEENRPGVRATVRDLRYTLDVFAQHVDSVAANVEGTSRNLLELSRRLKRDPSLLLRGGAPQSDEAALPGGG